MLQGLDGVESVVPNEMLVSGAVHNYSLSNKMVRVATQISVAYDSDLDLVLVLLGTAASGIERVATAPPPMATLQRFGADGVELELGFWINDPENGRGGVASDVNRATWRALQAHQISVPYPRRSACWALLQPRQRRSVTTHELVDRSQSFVDKIQKQRTIGPENPYIG